MAVQSRPSNLFMLGHLKTNEIASQLHMRDLAEQSALDLESA